MVLKFSALFLSVLLPLAIVSAEEIGPEDDLRGAIATLQPGEELVLRGGTYTVSSRFLITVNGSLSKNGYNWTSPDWFSLWAAT